MAPPEYAIEVLIAERMSALQTVRERSVELASRVRSITQEVDPTELIEVVSGEGSVRQPFLQVIKSAREEIAVFDRPPYAAEVNEAMSGQAQRLSAGGLRLRTVFDRSLLEDPIHVRRILQGVDSGERARVARVPLKMAIIDGEWAMLPLLHAQGQTPEAVVIVRRSVLLDSLVALFESVWQHAVEVKPRTAARAPARGGDDLHRHRTPPRRQRPDAPATSQGPHGRVGGRLAVRRRGPCHGARLALSVAAQGQWPHPDRTAA